MWKWSDKKYFSLREISHFSRHQHFSRCVSVASCTRAEGWWAYFDSFRELCECLLFSSRPAKVSRVSSEIPTQIMTQPPHPSQLLKMKNFLIFSHFAFIKKLWCHFASFLRARSCSVRLFLPSTRRIINFSVFLFSSWNRLIYDCLIKLLLEDYSPILCLLTSDKMSVKFTSSIWMGWRNEMMGE